MGDIRKGCEVHKFPGHDDWVRIVAVTPDGRFAVSGGHDDCRLCVWDLEKRSLLHPPFLCGDPINDLAFSADGRFCVSADNDHRIRLWDIVSGKERPPAAYLGSQVRSVAITADARTAVAGTAD